MAPPDDALRTRTITNDGGSDTAGLPPSDSGGRYQIEGVWSHGGLGMILQARDRELGRVVAIKQMLAPRPEREARFRREALLTARLQHPSIVPVYEVGRWPTGEPFYVMKLVAGRTLAEHIEERRTLASRLGLLPHVRAVADALAYAHEQRIIHRDLKPANVVIGDFGETVVLDWGLGKQLGEPDLPAGDDGPAASPDHTSAGTILGTPRYMAPEQAAGVEVDERADVYALGAILYTVLSGAPPYASLASDELLPHVGAHAPPAVEALQPDTPADLAAIVRTAMARDPAARYATARELRDELRRFLDGQLVRSHDYSVWQLVRRFVARHRLPVALAAVLLSVIGGGGGISLRRITQARVVAERARGEAERRRDQLALAQARGALAADPTAALAWIKTYPATATNWSAARRVIAEALDGDPARHIFRDVGSARLSPAGDQIALAGEQQLRVCILSSGQCRGFDSPDGQLDDVVFAPDDQRIATASDDGHIRIWQASSGASRLLPGATVRGRLFVLQFTPDGRRLLFLEGARLGVWDFATDRATFLDGHEGGTADIASLSPDGRFAAVTGLQREGVRLWDLAAGTSRLIGSGPRNGGEIVFAPDGSRLWSASAKLPIIDELSTVGGRDRQLEGHHEQALSMALRPGGRELISGSDDGEVRLWDLASGQSRLIGRHASWVTALAVSPDGAWVASTGADGSVWLLHVASGDRHTLRGHTNQTEMLQFSADGRWLVSTGSDRTARVWPLPAPRRRVVHAPTGLHATPAFAPDGRHVAWGGTDGRVRVCEAASGDCRMLDGAVDKIQSLEFAPDGRLLAAGRVGRLWDATLTASRLLWEHDLPMIASFSPDGRWVAGPGNFARKVYLYETQGGQPAREFALPALTQCAGFSGDSRRLTWGDEDGHIGLVDLASGTQRTFAVTAGLQVSAVALSFDGRTLASGDSSGWVRAWDVERGTARQLGHHNAPVTVVRLSPDGKLLASAGWDQTVRWWTLSDGAPHLGRGHRGPVNWLRFSPDGRLLASGGDDGLIGLWDPATGESRLLPAHERPLNGFSFAPDGRQLVTSSEDGTVQIWTLDPPRATLAPAALLTDVARATTAALDADDLPTTR